MFRVAQAVACGVDTSVMNTLRPQTQHRSAACAVTSAHIWLSLQFDAAIQGALDAAGACQTQGRAPAAARAWQAASVVQALQTTLDMRRGGELARQLFDLFDYVQRRLRVNETGQSAAAYREAADLLSQVRQAWQSEPQLVPTRWPELESAVVH